MPYKSGLIQAAVGAFATLAFVISHQFGGAEPKEKRVQGLMQKTGERTFLITEGNAQQHSFVLAESASLFFNEKEISFSVVENGRNVSVVYTKEKGRLVAKIIDVFPNHTDFA